MSTVLDVASVPKAERVSNKSFPRTKKNARRSRRSLRAFSSFLEPSQDKLGDIDIDQVLEDQLQEPFTQENFRQFLVAEVSEENFEFYQRTLAYKEVLTSQSHEQSKHGSEEQIGKLVVLEEVNKIAQDYISYDAPKQVNISSSLRKEIMRKVSESIENENAELSLFDDALREVKYLMRSGPFERFLAAARTRNISKMHANWRLRLGIYGFIAGFAVLGASICVQLFLDNPVADSIFTRLIAFPMYFFGFFQYLSGLRCLCPMLVWKGNYMTQMESKNWKTLLFNRKEKEPKLTNNVQDRTVLRMHHILARRIVIEVFLKASLLAVLSLLIPPTFYFDIDLS